MQRMVSSVHSGWGQSGVTAEPTRGASDTLLVHTQSMLHSCV